MLNFEDIENLAAYMFENLDNEDNLVSVISNKAMAVEIMKELLTYENVILNSCEMDADCEYDKEYLITVYDVVESEYWYVNIEKIFNHNTGKYLGVSGYVLFHEDVNSKAMVDMLNNEFMPLGEHDWFVIGDEDESEEDVPDSDPVDDNIDSADTSDFSVSIKTNIDTDELEKIMEDIRKITSKEIPNLMDKYCICAYLF